MGDEDRFSNRLREAVCSRHLDGQNMVEASKLILLIDYSDKEYDNELFTIFNILIDEERDGLSFDKIEQIYKASFVKSLAEFRRLFSI